VELLALRAGVSRRAAHQDGRKAIGSPDRPLIRGRSGRSATAATRQKCPRPSPLRHSLSVAGLRGRLKMFGCQRNDSRLYNRNRFARGVADKSDDGIEPLATCSASSARRSHGVDLGNGFSCDCYMFVGSDVVRSIRQFFRPPAANATAVRLELIRSPLFVRWRGAG
jgi:hypothetical protein